MSISVIILTLNEEINLAHSLPKLLKHFEHVEVWDSGSIDQSRAMATEAGAIVKDYLYVTHARAYEDIIEGTAETDYCVILDADMDVSDELALELKQAANGTTVVADAPVTMVHFGETLKHASLYPPKPILFRGGKSPFVAVGHGERIADNVAVTHLNHPIVHNDQKTYSRYLQSQAFYGEKIGERYLEGNSKFSDKLRAHGPCVAFFAVIRTYFLRGGFRDGQGGYLYALDRFIAELIMYRQAWVTRRRVSLKQAEKND